MTLEEANTALAPHGYILTPCRDGCSGDFWVDKVGAKNPSLYTGAGYITSYGLETATPALLMNMVKPQ